MGQRQHCSMLEDQRPAFDAGGGIQRRQLRSAHPGHAGLAGRVVSAYMVGGMRVRC